MTKLYLFVKIGAVSDQTEEIKLERYAGILILTGLIAIIYGFADQWYTAYKVEKVYNEYKNERFIDVIFSNK